eukprot:13010585-Alexandrium_andersonii.AAC.1
MVREHEVLSAKATVWDMNENLWDDDARAATEDLNGFVTPADGVWDRVFRNSLGGHRERSGGRGLATWQGDQNQRA